MAKVARHQSPKRVPEKSAQRVEPWTDPTPSPRRLPIYVGLVLSKIDMRGVHKVRNRFAPLGKGTANLLLNRALTIARFIVPDGGVWTYYAPKGKVWDEMALQAAVDGMRLRITWREGVAMPEIVVSGEEDK